MKGSAPWRIPDDGIIDETAIDIAVKGQRQVKLTRREMLIAARRILDNGGQTNTLVKHIGLSRSQAKIIAAQLREESVSDGAARS